MGCELNCAICTIRDCGMRSLNAFINSGADNSKSVIAHTQTRNQLHIRINARQAAKIIKGSSGGGGGGGIPPAISVNPELYVIDQLKSEANSKK